MFSLLRQFTKLNERNDDGTEWNVFEKDQGSEQWPDLAAYKSARNFDVTVSVFRGLIASFMQSFGVVLEILFGCFVSDSRKIFYLLLICLIVTFNITYYNFCLYSSQCGEETCGYNVASGVAEGLA